MNGRRISDIDWMNWVPVDRATLVFVIRKNQILLIRKKRGLGAGKISGPGGRLEPGESFVACAIREVREELGVEVSELVQLGEHRFQFIDEHSIHVHVYRTHKIDGVPIETDEAVPLWFSLNEIPFDEMWEDDKHWLPLVVQSKRFSGDWLFDRDQIVDYRLALLE